MRGSPERRVRVLVIDDAPVVRGLVYELLMGLGYAAEGAADGAEGLARLDRGGYDLVVTNLVMPALSGLAVAEAVRRGAPGMPVILISGWAREVESDRLRRQGLTVVRKPFHVDELEAVVRQALPPHTREIP